MEPPNRTEFTAQRARGAWVASNCQPEATFDYSFAAQSTDPAEEDAKSLDKRITWQRKNASRGLRFVPLGRESLQLIVFTDAAFVNNDGSPQLGCSRLPTASLQTSSIGRPSNAGESPAGESPAAFWLRNYFCRHAWVRFLGRRQMTNPPWKFSAEGRARETQHQSRGLWPRTRSPPTSAS